MGIERDHTALLGRSWVRYGGGILALLVAGYFGIWWYKDLAIDQSIETREGLVQRAAAYQKSRDYDAIAGAGSPHGGSIGAILRRPWKPDQEERNGANEFAALTIDGLAYLDEQGLACGVDHLLGAEEPGEAQLAFLDRVAEKVTFGTLAWQDPPIATLLSAMAEDYPCAGEMRGNPAGV